MISGHLSSQSQWRPSLLSPSARRPRVLAARTLATPIGKHTKPRTLPKLEELSREPNANAG